jgi:hypothetical protein
MSIERVFAHGKWIDVEPINIGPKRKPRARRRLFVLVPLVWMDRLNQIKANACTYRVALHILWKSFQRRGEPITMPNNIPGVSSRSAKRLALLQLEKAKLISVERRQTKSPIVTVLSLD